MAWATGINDHGQVVGVSGKCMSPNFNLTGRNPKHGVIWQNGKVSDLGDLGGTRSTFPWAINEDGQVTGYSTLPDNATVHTFLWQDGSMTDLGTVPPDVNSQAFGLNGSGDVVGGSGCEFICRAYVWHDGVMTDLNTLIAPGSAPDYLLFGNDIDDQGVIALYAFNTVNHASHAAVAIPCDDLPGVPGCNADALTASSAKAAALKAELMRRWLAATLPPEVRRLMQIRSRSPETE